MDFRCYIECQVAFLSGKRFRGDGEILDIIQFNEPPVIRFNGGSKTAPMFPKIDVHYLRGKLVSKGSNDEITDKQAYQSLSRLDQ